MTAMTIARTDGTATGIAIVVAASVLGGLSVTPGMLIAARVLQGIGAALTVAVAFPLLALVLFAVWERRITTH